jgi:hypothetical protein
MDRRQFDAIHDSGSCHRAGQPARLTRCRTPRRSAISRSLARVVAKNRPNNEPLRSFPFGLASSERCTRTARRSRRAPPRSRPFPGDRVDPCNRPVDVAPQREALHHAFTRRVQPTAVFDRPKPQRLFRAGRRLRTGNAAAAGRFELGGLAFGLDVLDALLDRCIIARLRCLGDLGRHRVQLYINIRI